MINRSRSKGGAPWWLRAWVAMWVLTISPIVFILLAGFDVGRFHDLWINGWQGIVAATGVGMAMKFGKDAVIGKEVAKQGGDPDAGVVPGD